MSHKLYLYPKGIRFWHWFNALIFILLILSGLSLQYSGKEFVLFCFICSVTMHNITGIAVSVLWLFFVMYNRITRNGIHYQIERQGYFERLKRQFHYYLIGIFRGEEKPFPLTEKSKFNPLQQFSYLVVMYFLMPILIISGLMLLFPSLIFFDFKNITGLQLTALIHIITAFILSLFFVVHIYLCTIGPTPWSNFRAMITGYHE
ncbi:MAG: hypothetical protein Kow00127_22360 [Bacteroidales bacterium]